MLSRSAIIFGTILLFFNTVLHAESSVKSLEQNTDRQRINLQQAISKTFEHNPALRSFSYALKAQQGRQFQAGLTASPELSFMVEDALGTGDFTGLDNAQATLGIAWVVEGEIRQSYIDVADAGASSLSSEADSKRLDAAAETAHLYIVVLANQTRLSNAIKTVTLAEDTVLAVKKRVLAGKTPGAELARARAEFYRRQLGHEDIEHELKSSIRLLAAQWGETQPDFNQVEGNIFKLPTILPFDVLKKQLERSPEFTRLMSEERLNQAQLNLAESKSDSPWRVNLGIRHFETSNDQALVAGISIPFGERSRNTGGIIEARENLSQTQAQADALKVRFETTLYVLSEEMQHAHHSVGAYHNDIIPQLEKALKETRRAYNLGRYSYLEWRTVQVDLLDARSALVEASIDMHLKVIEIERLTGVSMVQLATQAVSKS